MGGYCPNCIDTRTSVAAQPRGDGNSCLLPASWLEFEESLGFFGGPVALDVRLHDFMSGLKSFGVQDLGLRAGRKTQACSLRQGSENASSSLARGLLLLLVLLLFLL